MKRQRVEGVVVRQYGWTKQGATETRVCLDALIVISTFSLVTPLYTGTAHVGISKSDGRSLIPKASPPDVHSVTMTWPNNQSILRARIMYREFPP
jgi:hypothetical protein